ncbi:hypothetical protein GW17_00002157 [Ensete ventricosum]|nr:hypothetical protein GW17_00002157 [Ensete ventricosum]
MALTNREKRGNDDGRWGGRPGFIGGKRRAGGRHERGGRRQGKDGSVGNENVIQSKVNPSTRGVIIGGFPDPHGDTKPRAGEVVWMKGKKSIFGAGTSGSRTNNDSRTRYTESSGSHGKGTNHVRWMLFMGKCFRSYRLSLRPLLCPHPSCYDVVA